jgi:hypothetical protein
LMGRVGRRLGLTLSFAIATLGAVLSIYAIICSILLALPVGDCPVRGGASRWRPQSFCCGGYVPRRRTRSNDRAHCACRHGRVNSGSVS